MRHVFVVCGFFQNLGLFVDVSGDRFWFSHRDAERAIPQIANNLRKIGVTQFVVFSAPMDVRDVVRQHRQSG